MRTIAELTEDALIQIFARDPFPAGPEVLVGNGDDAAVFGAAKDEKVVVTTDSLVEGQHFDLRYTPPAAVGEKLVAVNLSDLAAMGATPRYLLVSACLPAELPVETLSAMAEGLRRACHRYSTHLIGGNVSRTRGPIVLSATAIGFAEALLLRKSSQPGDAIFVSGTLGDARAGLLLCQNLGAPPVRPLGPSSALFSALFSPSPRTELGQKLVRIEGVHACCDVSDGLGRDLLHLLVPPLGARLSAEAIPISPSLRAAAPALGIDALELALTGGEDYELLFTASPEAEAEIRAGAASVKVGVSRIGTVSTVPGVVVDLVDGKSRALPPGFEHFS